MTSIIIHYMVCKICILLRCRYNTVTQYVLSKSYRYQLTTATQIESDAISYIASSLIENQNNLISLYDLD